LNIHPGKIDLSQRSLHFTLFMASNTHKLQPKFAFLSPITPLAARGLMGAV
jgi:hypothetical protein